MCSEPTKTTAEEAVAYIIRRIRIDANFAWLMLGTESLAMCVKAHAERLGQPEADVAAEIVQRAASNSNVPEVLKLRAKVEAFEKQASKSPLTHDQLARNRDLNRDAIRRVEDLVRTAEIMGEKLTVEHLRDAISPPPRYSTF